MGLFSHNKDPEPYITHGVILPCYVISQSDCPFVHMIKTALLFWGLFCFIGAIGSQPLLWLLQEHPTLPLTG